MKNTLIILMFIPLLISCSKSSIEEKQIEDFNKILGEEKIKALELAINSFNQFNRQNFTDDISEKEKMISFLTHFNDTSYINKLKFDYLTLEKTLTTYEESGLRKEIMVYSFEMDDYNERLLSINTLSGKRKDIELKRLNNSREFNFEGLYLKALKNIRKPDSLLVEYIDMKIAAGDIASDILTNGLIYGLKYRKVNYEVLKRIVIVELYYDLIKWKLERKKFSA